MAVYDKKLHVRKNGKVYDIILFTEKSDAGTNVLSFRDSGKVVYAGLTAYNASYAMHVRKNGVKYSVAPEGANPSFWDCDCDCNCGNCDSGNCDWGGS